MKENNDTLCWYCNKTCGRCSWTKSFIPVKGWEAEQTFIKTQNTFDSSYLVKSCPEFEPRFPIGMSDSKYSYLQIFRKFYYKFNDEECDLFMFWLNNDFEAACKKYQISNNAFKQRLCRIKSRLRFLKESQEKLKQYIMEVYYGP